MTGRDGTDKGGGEDKDLSNYISPHSYCFIEEEFLGIEKKYLFMGRSKEIKMKMRCQRVLSLNMQWVMVISKETKRSLFQVITPVIKILSKRLVNGL